MKCNQPLCQASKWHSKLSSGKECLLKVVASFARNNYMTIVLTLNLPPKVYYKEWAAYTLWGIIALIMFIPVIYLCSDFKNKLIRIILAISYFIVFIPIFCFLIFMFSDTLHCIKHKLIKIDENYKYTIESPWLESCDYKTTYKSINFIFYQEMETEVVPCY